MKAHSQGLETSALVWLFNMYRGQRLAGCWVEQQSPSLQRSSCGRGGLKPRVVDGPAPQVPLRKEGCKGLTQLSL